MLPLIMLKTAFHQYLPVSMKAVTLGRNSALRSVPLLQLMETNGKRILLKEFKQILLTFLNHLAHLSGVYFKLLSGTCG